MQFVRIWRVLPFAVEVPRCTDWLARGADQLGVLIVVQEDRILKTIGSVKRLCNILPSLRLCFPSQKCFKFTRRARDEGQCLIAAVSAIGIVEFRPTHRLRLEAWACGRPRWKLRSGTGCLRRVCCCLLRNMVYGRLPTISIRSALKEFAVL